MRLTSVSCLGKSVSPLSLRSSFCRNLNSRRSLGWTRARGLTSTFNQTKQTNNKQNIQTLGDLHRSAAWGNRSAHCHWGPVSAWIWILAGVWAERGPGASGQRCCWPIGQRTWCRSLASRGGHSSGSGRTLTSSSVAQDCHDASLGWTTRIFTLFMFVSFSFKFTDTVGPRLSIQKLSLLSILDLAVCNFCVLSIFHPFPHKILLKTKIKWLNFCFISFDIHFI